MKEHLEKNKLHDLIHSLSKSDKAYLKKNSKIFNTKTPTIHKIYYLIMEKMEVFSSAELKRKLEKNGGVRRFKNAELEVYSQILEDLVIIKSKKRPTWQYYIEHMKLGYLFLASKHEEAMKQFDVLKKVKNKAKNVTIDYIYHKFYYHHVASININRTPEEMEKEKMAEDDLRKSIEDLQLEFLIEAAYFNFENYRFNTYNKTRTQFIEGLKPFTEKYVDVLPKSLQSTKFKMLSIYYHFFCNYSLKTLNMEDLNTYSERYYLDFKIDNVKTQFSMAYINALYFRISYLVMSKDEKVYDLLKEFKEYLNIESIESKSFLHAMYCQCSLLTYVNMKNETALDKFIENEIEVYQKEFKTSTIRVILATDLRWAIGLFTLKRYKDVQVFLNKIYDALGKIKDASNSILISARLLDILIHFELKNYENINYYINNLEKEIKRRKQYIQFDKDFFGHLKKMNQSYFANEKPDFKTFINFLKTNENQDRVESYLSIIDMVSWLNNKENS